MNKKEKIFILLILLCFFLLAYIITLPKAINQQQLVVKEDKTSSIAGISTAPIINLKDLEQNYQNSLKEKFKIFENKALAGQADGHTDISDAAAILTLNADIKEQIKNLKNDVLSMTVPSDMRHLHIGFVLALDKFNNYIALGNKEDKITSLDFLQDSKKKYSWLAD
jgi:hypothetical protein